MTGAAVAASSTGPPGVIAGVPSAVTSGGVPSGITMVNNGTHSVSGASAGNWVNPATSVIAAQWEVRATLTAGSIDTGTLNTWQALSTSRGWSKNGIGTATLTYEWRPVGQTGAATSQQTGVTITVGA